MKNKHLLRKRKKIMKEKLQWKIEFNINPKYKLEMIPMLYIARWFLRAK
jgi:hypothetical protein